MIEDGNNRLVTFLHITGLQEIPPVKGLGAGKKVPFSGLLVLLLESSQPNCIGLIFDGRGEAEVWGTLKKGDWVGGKEDTVSLYLQKKYTQPEHSSIYQNTRLFISIQNSLGEMEGDYVGELSFQERPSEEPIARGRVRCRITEVRYVKHS